MSIRIITKSNQAYGAFNNGQIIENKPIGFPQDGGFVRPYSNLFYWARAEAVIDSTIGLHPHQGFEIMSFVLEGSIRHFDTQMNDWKELHTGSAQIIRSGNGIKHAEHMNKGSVMFQIWVDPNLDKTLEQPASYSDYSVDQLPVTVDGENQITHYIGEKGPMTLDAPHLEINRYSIKDEHVISLKDNEMLSIYMINGNGTINGDTFEQDDFAIIEDENEIKVQGKNVDLFVIKSQSTIPYPTYAERMQRRTA